MYRKLQEWVSENQPKDTMYWKEGFYDQIKFVRDTIPSVLARSYEEYVGIQKGIRVISTHSSKSINLPVYRLEWNRYIFIIRENFYNWKITVRTPFKKPADYDFMKLFNEDLEISLCYCEGFADADVHGSFSNNKEEFTIEIENNYGLWTFFWILKHNAVKEEC